MINNPLTAKEYGDFCTFLAQHCGIVLGANKQYLVKSRLTPLLSQFGCQSLSELVKQVMAVGNRGLRAVVIDAMTTNETLWFRDSYPFELLTTRLLPEFSQLPRALRIWSSASSSGQEAYSIAMTCLEYQAKNPTSLSRGFEILATDIATSMIELGKKGEYDSLALGRGLSRQRLNKFFSPSSSGCYQVNPEVQRYVKFRQFNLLNDYAMLGKFDIIFCRNVLIYFSPDIKRQIFGNFSKAINSKGYLMLGASESISGLSDSFEMDRCDSGIVYKSLN